MRGVRQIASLCGMQIKCMGRPDFCVVFENSLSRKMDSLWMKAHTNYSSSLLWARSPALPARPHCASAGDRAGARAGRRAGGRVGLIGCAPHRIARLAVRFTHPLSLFRTSLTISDLREGNVGCQYLVAIANVNRAAIPKYFYLCRTGLKECTCTSIFNEAVFRNRCSTIAVVFGNTALKTLVPIF